MTNVSINKQFHLNLQGTKAKIVFAVIVSYITSYSANIFTVYFPRDIYYYNKFLVGALISVIAVNLYSNHNFQLKAPGFSWFCVFFGYALLHGFYPGGDQYLKIALGLLKIYFLFLVIINLFKTRKDYTILGITYTAVVAITMTVYYIHAKRYGWATRITSELLGFSVNANTVSYISTLAFITYTFAIRNRSFKGRSLSRLFILAGAATIISANGSVGAAFLLAFAVVFTMLDLKNAKVLLLSVCFILSIGYVYLKYAPHAKLITQRIETKIKAEGNEERFHLTQIALDLFWDEPIWGKGYDSLHKYRGGTVNHCWYLNLLVAYGILGFLFVFMWYTSIFPIRKFFVSRHSTILMAFILIFILLAPPLTYLSLAMAFLYNETHKKIAFRGQHKSAMMKNRKTILIEEKIVL